MKIYTFIDDNGNIIEQVRAENYEQAIAQAIVATSENDFYSESI